MACPYDIQSSFFIKLFLLISDFKLGIGLTFLETELSSVRSLDILPGRLYKKVCRSGWDCSEFSAETMDFLSSYTDMRIPLNGLQSDLTTLVHDFDK